MYLNLKCKLVIINEQHCKVFCSNEKLYDGNDFFLLTSRLLINLLNYCVDKSFGFNNLKVNMQQVKFRDHKLKFWGKF